MLINEKDINVADLLVFLLQDFITQYDYDFVMLMRLFNSFYISATLPLYEGKCITFKKFKDDMCKWIDRNGYEDLLNVTYSFQSNQENLIINPGDQLCKVEFNMENVEKLDQVSVLYKIRED